MPIDRDALLATVATGQPVSYSEKDVMLYALGIGFGRDPGNGDELSFVAEHQGLSTVPTMASMLAPNTVLANSGVEVTQVLHSAQAMTLHRPLAGTADLIADQSVSSVWDRGPNRGAELTVETELRRARDDTVVCTLQSVIIARGDGGFGGPAPPLRQRTRLPNREPDFVAEFATRRDQALLFRLSGDFNPLHASPAAARIAGFDRPVLHGRCTYGIACKAILETVCAYDYTLIRDFDVRFSAPVFPGDVITTEMWQSGDTVSFRSRVAERDTTVLGEGRCVLGG